MNIIQKNSKKIACFIVSFLMLIGGTFVSPLFVSARDFQQTLPSPFLGVMSYVSFSDSKIASSSGMFDVEADGNANWSGSFTGTGRCSLLEPTGVCDEYVYNINESPSNPIRISFPNLDVTGITSYSYSTSYTITFDFVFDSDYVGSFVFNYDGINYTCFVNGSSASISLNFDYQTSNVNILLSSLNLARRNTSNWSFPVESFGTVSTFSQYQYPMVDFMKGSNYIYPIFSVPVNSQIDNSTVYTSGVTNYVFFIDKAVNANNLSTYFSCDPNITLSAEVLSTSSIGGNPWRLINLTMTASVQSRSNLVLLRASSFVPVFCSPSNYTHVGTDFALQFGLTNDLLEYLKVLVNGTSSSSSSVEELEDKKDDFNDIMSQHDDIEQSIADDFDVAIQQIDNSFDLHDFGEDFLNSSQFVKTTFNRLTLNNPIGSAIFYSLLLGFALLIFGKSL